MAMVDVDDETVLSAIFKDSFPDAWRNNPDFSQYLTELSSYGVDKLSREPDRLAEDRAHTLEQTQELAFHNYKTFIQTAECSREICQDFQIIEKHLGDVLEKMPQLNTYCNEFTKKANEINSNRRMNNLTLQRHTQLLEILEMPQLMDTCVRNGYYEEALELASHVKRLEKKHSSLPVIMNIVNEVKGSTQLMLNQLIQQLRSNVQLPACLRVIGYVRRMDVFTEAELRIKFLQARDSWFQSILNNIPADDPYYHITKTIEASRVHLFDIITQYRAIFSDEDPLLTQSSEDSPNESALFHGWVVQKIEKFLHTLEYDLSRGVGGRLDSLLGQCMYFGLSFSRVGADFRGLLAPIFQRAAVRGFCQIVDEANRKFELAMQSYTLLGTPAVLPSSAFTLAAQGSGQLHPPMNLLQFQPLAAYTNDILGALNDLRLCAPLSLAIDVAKQLQDSLVTVVKVIIAFHRTEESTFNQQEQESFGEFCEAFCVDLVPYLNKCLQVLFPPSQLSQMLGVAAMELAKMGNLGLINKALVIKPIEHLLPVKEPEPEVEIPTVPETPNKSEETVETEDTENSEKEPDSEPTADAAKENESHKEQNESETITNTGADHADRAGAVQEESEVTNTEQPDKPETENNSSEEATGGEVVNKEVASDHTDKNEEQTVDQKTDDLSQDEPNIDSNM